MKFSYLTLVFLLLSIANTNDIRFTASSLPYQAHSFNDLSIAQNLLLRGVQYFKFDASLANRNSCEKFSTWDKKNTCFTSKYFSQDVCCIAIRGDAGSQNNFNHPFNTSAEFLQLFESFLSQHGKAVDLLFVAIDFQFKFEMQNPISEAFVLGLATLLQKYSVLNFAIGENFILEYDKICLHQQTQQKLLLAQQSCTNSRKMISDSRIVLQSGSLHPIDSRDHKGRYRNFNIYYQEIDRLCRDGFPTWPNKYPFRLIFWQPSNEDQIQNSMKKLMSPTCARKHNRTIDGIAFASNIDPQMFEIFLKQTQTKPFQQQFPWRYENKKIWIEGATKIKLTTISGVYDELSNSNERLVIYWQRTESQLSKNYLSVFSLNDQKNQINIVKTVTLHYPVQQIHGSGNKIYIIVKTSEGDSHDYNATIISFDSNLTKIQTRAITSYIISYANDKNIYYISRTSSSNYINLYVLTPDLKNSTQYGVSTYISKTQADLIKSIYFKKGNTIDEDVFLILGDVDDQNTWIAQIKYGNIHIEKTLAFGTNAKIIETNDGSIIISLQNSYSHSGLLLNNNAENKCLLHKKRASERLAHLPHLINFLKGSFNNLVEFLNSDDAEILTACNSHMFFAKHLNGAEADITSAFDQTFISSLYVPLNKQDLMMALFSGGSNYESTMRHKQGFLITSINANRRFTKESNKEFQTQ